MNTSCPTGFEHDSWFIIQSQVMHNVATVDCKIHSFTLSVLTYILFALLLLAFTLIIIKSAEELSKPNSKRNNYICIIAMLSIWTIPFCLVILYWRRSLSIGVNFSLFGLALVPYMISVRYALNNSPFLIPLMFITKQKRGLINNDQFIRINTVVSYLLLFIVGLAWGRFMPSQKDDKNMIIFYKIGCFCMFIIMISFSITSWKYTSNIIDMMDSVMPSSQQLRAISRVQTTTTNASFEKIKAIRKRLAFARMLCIACVLFGSLWVFHLTILPFYWYVVIIHMFGIASFYFSIIYLHPINYSLLMNWRCKYCFNNSSTTGTITVIRNNFSNNIDNDSNTATMSATSTTPTVSAINHHEEPSLSQNDQ